MALSRFSMPVAAHQSAVVVEAFLLAVFWVSSSFNRKLVLIASVE